MGRALTVMCGETAVVKIRGGSRMIRRAEWKDIPVLMEIYNDAILHTTATFDTEIKTYEERQAWFAEHTGRHVIYVYEEAGTVCGYASLSRYRDRKAFEPAVEISIYIHSKYRGRGIGRKLMEQTMDFAEKNEEIGTVISLITSDNEASIHLHEAFGFQYCGQIKNAGIKFGKNLCLNAYQVIYERKIE